MPIYPEKIKDPKTGKMIDKKVDGQKQYYIRTYVTDEYGNNKQIKRRNKKWLGREGYNLAMQEEARLRNSDAIATERKKNITIRELKKIYLNYVSPTIDKDSLKAKKIKLDHFCEIDKTKQVQTFPDMKISKYTKDMYMQWKNEMKNKKYNGTSNYSIKYLNKIHNEVCAMLDFAIGEGYCKYNFARQSGKIGTTKEIKLSNRDKVYTVIDFSEYKRLMNATKDNLKYNTIFDLWFTRGPRPGEIRAFRVKDFNYGSKQLMVNHTLSKANELKDPKTASSKAPIDLDDELNEKINNLILDLKQHPDFNNDWFIFNGATPISTHALENNKNKYFKIANINKHITLHELRHSCATWLFSLGVPITVISKIMRHRDIATTMSTYTHLIKKDYIDELNRINEYKQAQK